MLKFSVEQINKYFKDYMLYMMVCAVSYLFYDNGKLHGKIENIYETVLLDNNKILVKNNDLLNQNNDILKDVKRILKKED